jgi:hypothetical protein
MATLLLHPESASALEDVQDCLLVQDGILVQGGWDAPLHGELPAERGTTPQTKHLLRPPGNLHSQ